LCRRPCRCVAGIAEHQRECFVAFNRGVVRGIDCHGLRQRTGGCERQRLSERFEIRSGECRTINAHNIDRDVSTSQRQLIQCDREDSPRSFRNTHGIAD